MSLSMPNNIWVEVNNLGRFLHMVVLISNKLLHKVIKFNSRPQISNNNHPNHHSHLNKATKHMFMSVRDIGEKRKKYTSHLLK